MATGSNRQLLISAVRTTTDYVLIVLYGSLMLLALGASLRAGLGRSQPGELWGTLRYGYYLTTSFYFRAILFGLVHFAGAWGLRRLRIPRTLIALLGAIAAAVLSFFLVFDSARSPTIPLEFIFAFGYLPIPIPPFLGIVYGALILPRDAAGQAPRLSLRHWAVLLPLALMGLSTVRSSGEQSATAKREPEPQVIWVTWNPGLEPLTVQPFGMPGTASHGWLDGPTRPGAHIALTEVEIDRLRLARATGKMTVIGGVGNEQTSRGRCILILHQQLQEPFDYSRPEGEASVIYWQSSSSWQRLPTDAPASTRKGHLSASPDHPEVTCYDVDTVPPHRPLCGSSFFWTKTNGERR